MSGSSLTVHHLKTWDKCRRKYELDIVRGLKWPTDPHNFRLGKGVHQLLDYGARALALDILIDDMDKDIQASWELLVQSHWAQLPIVASEWAFSLAHDGHWFTGRIDRIVQNMDGHIRVLDWKTGTATPRLPETDWQSVIYLYAVYEGRRELGLSELPPEHFGFTYVQAKNNRLDAVEVPYSEAKHSETQQHLSRLLHQIHRAAHYPLPSACPDQYCPYNAICGIVEAVL